MLVAMGFTLFLGEISNVFAQNGKLTGRVYDKENKEALPYAAVKIFSGGAIKGGGVSDFDGKFSIAPITPGTYTIEVSSVGYNKYVIEKFTIGFEETKKIDFALTSSSTTTEAVEIVAYKEPLIGVDNGEKVSLSAEQIAKIPTRNVNSMIATQANVYSADDGGGVNIKGMRTGDNAVFINGIRQFGTSLPPAEAISELSIVAGGIPAQYGDALGGIISITTKTAAQKFSFGVQGETSSLFDKWHYNFAGINASGPIIKRKEETLADGTKTEGRTLLGFFGAVQYTSNYDNDPSALPIYKAKSGTLDSLRDKPQRRLPGTSSYTGRANFFNKNNFDQIKARPNVGDRNIQSNFNFDFQPSENMILTLGGNINYAFSKIGPNEDNGENNPNPNSYQNLFNFSNNGNREDLNYNTFLRFRQTFNTGIADTGSLLKNVYYQIQADYVRRNIKSYDPRFDDRLNEYNYVGKFNIKTQNINWPSQAPARTLTFRGVDDAGNIFTKDSVFTSRPSRQIVFQNEPQSITFEPSTINPDLTAINKQIFEENTIVNDFQLFGFNGFLNGPTGRGIADQGYFYPALGKSQVNFSRSRDEQYRLSFQAAAEIKNHTIKIGAEFEQRIIRNYSTSGSLFGRARQQINGHLTSGTAGENIRVDSSIVSDPIDPNFGKTLLRVYRTPFVNPLVDGSLKHQGQSDFDFNFRQRNGIPVGEEIFLDSYLPSSFSINDFSVSNILDNGNQPFAAWEGYSAYGSLAKRTSFFDFFKDTVNRPIDAFRPLYYAGFIEDKFEIGDLILRLGLRVDAFDVNMPVLKDKYTFTKLTTAKDFYTNANRTKPASVGNDWAVYVNNPARNFNGSNYNEFQVVGYRNGDTWYDQNGLETSNPASLEVNGSVNPFFDNFTVKEEYQKTLQRTNGITIDAYQDFKPQINLMPRVSFSFPLSEEALFYAHYDILTQRPLGVDDNGSIQQNYANPLDYYRLSINNGGFINNPNLKPQKKIDYALGFQQALNSRSSLKLSAFYSEIKDLIQVINVNYAYPIRYQTSGNQDFSVVKGLSLQYDLRKSDNFTASASYTLSFAEGSASNFAGALLNTSTPNLRNTTPLNFDQRHALKLNFDYRYGPGEGPEILGATPFENVGLNATFYTGSGTPFTQDGSQWGGKYQVKGSINGSRLPWNNRTSVRIDKSFILQSPGKRAHNINVYLYVQNLFNAQNVLSVYSRTSSATDDGFLASSFGQNLGSQQPNPDSYAMFYNMAIMNPDNISLPRRFRLGVSYNF